MSVPLSKRKPSNYQVIDTALSIYESTLKLCLKLPKRYTYLVFQKMVDLASEVADYARKAKSITPITKQEADLRILYWIESKASLMALISKINILIEMPNIMVYVDEKGHTHGAKQKELEQLSDLLNTELILLQEMITKDRKKFKKLY